jgi:hypothetical protein
MHTRPVLLAAALAVSIHAQTNVAATITTGNVTYTQSALPTTETIGTADVLDAGRGDILSQHWWWYRIGGDSREFAFKRDANATRVAVGSNMVTVWPDVDGRGVISAFLNQDVVSTGTNGGYLSEGLTILNLTANPIDIEVFSYTDYDVANSATNVTRGNGNTQTTIDSTNTVLSGDFLGFGSTGVQVGAVPSVSDLLTNTVADNLAGWPSGFFGPGDYSGAFQWSFVAVPPNGTVAVSALLANMGCRPSADSYGAGGAGVNGVPTIAAEFPVTVPGVLGGSVVNVRVANGAPVTNAMLLAGVLAANFTQVGLNVLVEPAGGSTDFAVTDATGAASIPISVPPIPAFCGINVFLQYYVRDQFGVNGIASFTDGLHLLVGSW